VCGHIDGISICKILVDGGVAVNLMPYTLYRKLRKQDDELVKTNMMLRGVGTDSSIKAKKVNVYLLLYIKCRGRCPCTLDL
jgi:hypothetical protein